MPKAAGFWIRLVAALVDFVLFAIVNASLGGLATRVLKVDLDDGLGLRGVLATCTALFVLLYVVVLHALAGQTIGKLVTGVRVVDADGAPPAFGVSLLRFFAYFASVLPLGLGFVMAGLRADRRALHDLLAGTRVERVSRRARRVESRPLEGRQEWISN